MDEVTRIGMGSWVQLGTLTLLVGGAISLTRFLTITQRDMKRALELLSAQAIALDGLRGTVEGVLARLILLERSDLVSRADMRLFLAELKGSNPTLNVPELPRVNGGKQS
jgi:hypothetical protein